MITDNPLDRPATRPASATRSQSRGIEAIEHATPVATERPAQHLVVLDSWRGISILLVLIAHLTPLGKINDSIGILGMVLFFNLSGFLITSLLLKPQATTLDFLIRRLFRIVPLAWLYLAVVFLFQQETAHAMIANFLFTANLPPKDIRLATDHLWSLCVEVQFYGGVALLFAMLRARGLLLLPLIALAVTCGRVLYGVHDSSVTWFRIDEILAGCTLALIYHGRFGAIGESISSFMRGVPQWALLMLLALSSLHGFEYGAWLAYFRPYLGALLIGATLLHHDTALVRAIDRKWLFRLAAISYSLYVIHIGLTHTWLGSGDLVDKYAKRPLLIAVLFALAYLSTYYYERPMIAIGKRLGRWLRRAPDQPAGA